MAMVTDEELDPKMLPRYIDLGDGSETEDDGEDRAEGGIEEGEYGEDGSEAEDDDEGEDEDDEKMSDDDILKIIRSEVEDAADLQSERQDNQTEATDYFYGRLPAMTAEESDANMANIVSTDVGDAVEAVLAEIVPAFSGQSPVEFVPLSADDEDQADLETRAVNHVANAAGAFMALNMAGKDALLRRAGVVKVFWEERVKVEYQALNHSIDQMPEQLQEGEGEKVEIASADMDENGTVTGYLRRYKKTGKPRIIAVPRDEFLISSDATNPNADEARFKAHQCLKTRSELIELGFDAELVEHLEAFDQTTNPARAARSPRRNRW